MIWLPEMKFAKDNPSLGSSTTLGRWVLTVLDDGKTPLIDAFVVDKTPYSGLKRT